MRPDLQRLASNITCYVQHRCAVLRHDPDERDGEKRCPGDEVAYIAL
jgi:hypothetical protein